MEIFVEFLKLSNTIFNLHLHTKVIPVCTCSAVPAGENADLGHTATGQSHACKIDPPHKFYQPPMRVTISVKTINPGHLRPKTLRRQCRGELVGGRLRWRLQNVIDCLHVLVYKGALAMKLRPVVKTVNCCHAILCKNSWLLFLASRCAILAAL